MRGTTEQQTDIVQVYERYLNIRDELMECSGLGSSLLYAGPVLPWAASEQASGNDSAPTKIISPAVAVLGE